MDLKEVDEIIEKIFASDDKLLIDSFERYCHTLLVNTLSPEKYEYIVQKIKKLRK